MLLALVYCLHVSPKSKELCLQVGGVKITNLLLGDNERKFGFLGKISKLLKDLQTTKSFSYKEK